MTPLSRRRKERHMQRISTLLMAAALVLFAFGYASAQDHPNFSGSWTLDPSSAPAPAGGAGGGGGRGGRGGGGGAGFGQAFNAQQTDEALTISRMQGDQTVTLTYKLDGSESTNAVPGRGGEPQDQVSKATWEGDKLAITTTLNFGGNSVEQKRVLSMDGDDLVVEQTNPGRGGGEATTVRLVYKKG
jgi:hypothetical protein